MTNELTVNIASRVAVVGAGPVGAVAALAHARRGARVALCEANPSSARRLAGEWLHPPAIQVLRELGIDLPSAIPEHAAGQGFVVFPDDGSAPCLLPYGDGALGYSCRHQTLVETLTRTMGYLACRDTRVVPFAWAFSRTIGRALRRLGWAAWRSGQWGHAGRIAGALLGRLRWLVAGIRSGRARGESRPAPLDRPEPGRGFAPLPPPDSERLEGDVGRRRRAHPL